MVRVKVENRVDFSKLKTAREKAAVKALWLQGQEVIAETQRQSLVPIETGTLRRAAVVTIAALPNPDTVYKTAQTSNAQENLSVESVSETDDLKAYVSWNTPYAPALHESMRNGAPWPWRAKREGGPKWAEIALKAAQGKFAAIAARAMKEFFG